MNENDDFYKFEDRAYLSPTLSRDEQLQFVDTLRETMADKSAQVSADTYALGSQLPSNLGGLSGAEATFEARYRTPQLEQSAANLRLAAQQSALNTALTNLQNAYKKRYQDAMLAYQKRAATPSTTNNNDDDPYKGKVNVTSPEVAGDASSGVASVDVPGSTTLVVDGETTVTDTATGETIATDKPEQHANKDGWYLTNDYDRYGRRIVRNLYNGLEMSLEEFEWMGGKL